MNMYSKLAAAVIGAAFSVNALADAELSLDGTTASVDADLDICIEIPEILIFGVGSLGGTTGTTDDKIKFTVGTATGIATGPFSTPAPTAPTSTAAFDTSDLFGTPVASLESGTNITVATDTATVDVFLFSNAGRQVTVTTSFLGANGSTTHFDSTAHNGEIPIAEVITGENATVLTNPGLAAGTTNYDGTTAIINESAEWTYQYVPTTVPIAGLYEGVVTYTVTTP